MPVDTTADPAAATPDARHERYHFGHLNRLECRLLYQMLKSVGAGEGDGLFAALVAHMAAAERGRARARSFRRRAHERDG